MFDKIFKKNKSIIESTSEAFELINKSFLDNVYEVMGFYVIKKENKSILKNRMINWINYEVDLKLLLLLLEQSNITYELRKRPNKQLEVFNLLLYKIIKIKKLK